MNTGRLTLMLMFFTIAQIKASVEHELRIRLRITFRFADEIM
jgi:hypothetical protein